MPRRVRDRSKDRVPLLRHEAALEAIDDLCNNAARTINRNRDDAERLLDDLHRDILNVLERDFALCNIETTDFDPPLSPERATTLNAANKSQREFAAARLTKDTLLSVAGHIGSMQLAEPILYLSGDSHPTKFLNELDLPNIKRRMNEGPVKGVVKFETGRLFGGDLAYLMLAAHRMFKLAYRRAVLPPAFHRANQTWTERVRTTGNREITRLQQGGNKATTRVEELKLVLSSAPDLKDFLEYRLPRGNAEHTAIGGIDWFLRADDRLGGWQWDQEIIRFPPSEAMKSGLQHIAMIASPALMGNYNNMVAEVTCRYAGGDEERTPMYDCEWDQETQALLATSNLTVGPESRVAQKGFCAGTRLVKPTDEDFTHAMSIFSAGQVLTRSLTPFGHHPDGSLRDMLTPAEIPYMATLLLGWNLWREGELTLTRAEQDQWIGLIESIKPEDFAEQAAVVQQDIGLDRGIDLNAALSVD